MKAEISKTFTPEEMDNLRTELDDVLSRTVDSHQGQSMSEILTSYPTINGLLKALDITFTRKELGLL